MVKNAKALAAKLLERGFDLVTGGTDNHLMVVNLTNKGISGKDASTALGLAGITVNKNTVPFESRSPYDPSGIRLGTPALTTRGMKESEMATIGAFIDEAITHWKDENKLASVRSNVLEITRKFPLYTDLNYKKT